MAKTEEPSVKKVIGRLRKIGPSKWKRFASEPQSYGGYATELSGLIVDIECTGNSCNNATSYILQVQDRGKEGCVTYREGGPFSEGEISKFYDDLKKKVITYQERASTRKYNKDHEKTLDKLLNVLKE